MLSSLRYLPLSQQSDIKSKRNLSLPDSEESLPSQEVLGPGDIALFLLLSLPPHKRAFARKRALVGRGLVGLTFFVLRLGLQVS
jgi:hypothetical protein